MAVSKDKPNGKVIELGQQYTVFFLYSYRIHTHRYARKIRAKDGTRITSRECKKLLGRLPSKVQIEFSKKTFVNTPTFLAKTD